MKPRAKIILKNIFFPSLCFLFSIAIFFFSFPNPIFNNGLGFLAWLLLVPLIFLIDSLPLKWTYPVGFVWGYVAWTVYAYWLSSFHPMAGFVGAFVKAVPMGFVFLIFGLSRRAHPAMAVAIRLFTWIAQEYLGSVGFLGFPYGAIGYTQWHYIALIQLSSIGGIWLIGAVVVLPSIYIATNYIRKSLAPRQTIIFITSFVLLLMPLLVLSQKSFSALQRQDSLSVLLVQPNSDPWKAGLMEYTRELRLLKKLTDEGLQENPDTELVIWPETAFVPRIYWHRHFKEDPDYLNLVNELLNYLETKKKPDGTALQFIIGNHDARPYVNALGQRAQQDYNAAILFEGKEEIALYRKRHLVPFTEHFPYKKQFPFIYAALERADTHFWNKGSTWNTLPVGPFRVATPICYEDSFGYISREFHRAGADFLAVLSNDAWAHSRTSQMQHASMAVFRAVETRLPLVRVTASGETWAVDPQGRVIARAPSQIPAYLAWELSIYTKKPTLFVLYGDWFAYTALFALAFLLLLEIIIYTYNSNIHRKVIDE